MRFYRSYLLIVLLAILTATSSKVYAAFPLRPSQTATPNTETVAHQTDVDFKASVNGATERFTQKPASVPDHSDGMKGTGFGIASLVLGLGGLLALVGAIFSAPGLIVFTILGGIGATILGAVGLDRPKKGFAIAGLLIGIVTLLILNWELLEYAFTS